MRHASPLLRLLALLLALFASASHAAGTDGIYAQENNYRIEVRFEPGKLIVKEPNRSSVYTQRQGTAVYHYRNPANGSEYLLEAMADGKSLKAYKPQTPQNFTLLKLVKATGPAKSAGKCKALAIPVQNDQAANPNQEMQWGVRVLPDAKVTGTYLNEGTGSPRVVLNDDGSGTFEMFGAPNPQHVYAIDWWLQANCDGTLVASDYPVATQYYLIVHYKDKPYQGQQFDRIGLAVQKAADGMMFIFERSKPKQ